MENMATRKIFHILVIFFLCTSFCFSSAGTDKCLCMSDSGDAEPEMDLVHEAMADYCCPGMPAIIHEPMVNAELAMCCDEQQDQSCPCCIEQNDAKTDMAPSAVPAVKPANQDVVYIASPGGEIGTIGVETMLSFRNCGSGPRSSPIYLEVLSFRC